MGDNGEGKEKRCPFNCTCEECKLNVELQRAGAKFAMCSFTALVQMIAEINAKTQTPSVDIPKGLYRG